MKTQFILFMLLTIICNFPFILQATSTPSNLLRRGSSIGVEDSASNLLISQDKTFTCGFYTLDNTTNAYYFSIWFTNSKEKTLVWMANRKNPVNGHGSRFTLTKDGDLVLTDLDGSLVWNTKTSAVVSKAELLDSGNLVLRNTSGSILWQTFDFPTDTLLPNQYFTKDKKLVSKKSSNVFAEGYFSLLFDNDNVLKMVYDGPELSSIYWPNPDHNVWHNGRTKYNSSRVAVFDDKGTLVSSDQLRFRASDKGFGVKRRLTMDYDGNLRLYSLDNVNGLWTITWQAVIKPCSVYGLCGRNGICIYTPEPTCSCPPYHEPFNSSDWTKGCKPKFKRSCNDSEFLTIPHLNYYGLDLNFTKNTSFDDCRNLCLQDCRCQAFRHVTRRGLWCCYTKSDLFNGHRAKRNLYLRIPIRAQTIGPEIVLNESRLGCGSGRDRPKTIILPTAYHIASKNRRFRWVYVYSFVGAIGAIEVVIFVASWVFLFRKHGISASLEDGYRIISSHFRSFSYSELRKATSKFKQVLGSGGFGAVYKGVLADERVIAVKKLENIVQGEEEFWAEVSTFGRINHMNLARMWGFCSQAKHRLLVYEYVENGSLDKHLFSSSTHLDWKKRFKIALGTAKGLAYLHHECLEWVIHCDVKPENILLDPDFEPKISDFGLAKLCQRDDHHHGSAHLSKMRGTKGYMAPEWTTNLPLTAKVDVYSFGVVILELVRGIRMSTYLANENDVGEEGMVELRSFVRFAREKMQNGDDYWMMELVDLRLEGKFSRKQAAKMIEIGLSSVEDDRNKRPAMETVVQVLAECEDETTHI